MLVAINAYEAFESGAYRALGDAIPVLENLVTLTPNDTEVRMLFGGLLSDAGRYDDALFQYEQAILTDPMNSAVYQQIGLVNSQMREWEAASAGFEQSIALKPDQPNAHDGLAVARLAIGDAVGGIRSELNAIEIDSKDPEYTTWLASFLYAFDLIEEGNVYRDRTALIAPNNVSTRLANLEQALALGDVALSDRLARSMVEDDIEERFGTYSTAVYTVLANALQNEDAMEGLAFIEQHQPGFSDPSSSTIALKVRVAQSGAFAAWYATRTPEEAAQLVSDYWNVAEASGQSVFDSPMTYLEVLAIRGDTEEAIDFALSSVVNQPITLAIWWQETFDASYLSAVVADPRVQARLQQWDEDEITVRAEIKEFLAGSL
jgi:tetratricopeptide (TPR) repeat protein